MLRTFVIERALIAMKYILYTYIYIYIYTFLICKNLQKTLVGGEANFVQFAVAPGNVHLDIREFVLDKH